MKISLKQSVNLLIVCSFIGMFISFPFQDRFIGGLLFAAFTAATIGGLADSFAVSALFGQPLRIPWPKWMGTRIIARNRQRLIDELSDMVEHELLSAEMIQRQLKDMNIANTLASYMTSPSGSAALKQLLRKILKDLIKLGHPAVVSLALKRLFMQGMSSSEPVKLAAKLLNWMVAEGHDTIVIKEISKQLKEFVKREAVRQFVYEFIATALRSYEHNKKSRQFVNSLAGLNAEELTVKVMKIAESTLSQLETGDHQWNNKLREWLMKLVHDWQHSEEAAQIWNGRFRKAGQFVVQYVVQEQNIESLKAKLIRQLEAVEKEEELNGFLLWLENKIDELLYSLTEESKQQKLNEYMINSINSLIERYHRYIGLLVRSKLEQFDEQQLIELVQDKAGKDLQYIRLNGTLVGSFIGVFLYFIQLLLGGLLS